MFGDGLRDVSIPGCAAIKSGPARPAMTISEHDKAKAPQRHRRHALRARRERLDPGRDRAMFCATGQVTAAALTSWRHPVTMAVERDDVDAGRRRLSVRGPRRGPVSVHGGLRLHSCFPGRKSAPPRPRARATTPPGRGRGRPAARSVRRSARRHQGSSSRLSPPQSDRDPVGRTATVPTRCQKLT